MCLWAPGQKACVLYLLQEVHQSPANDFPHGCPQLSQPVINSSVAPVKPGAAFRLESASVYRSWYRRGLWAAGNIGISSSPLRGSLVSVVSSAHQARVTYVSKACVNGTQLFTHPQKLPFLDRGGIFSFYRPTKMLLHLQPSHGTACRNSEQMQSLTIFYVISREKLQGSCREGEGAASAAPRELHHSKNAHLAGGEGWCHPSFSLWNAVSLWGAIRMEQ